MDEQSNRGGAAVRASLGGRRGGAVGRSRRALRPLLTERGRTSHSKGSSKGFSKAGPAVCFRRARGGVPDGFLLRWLPDGRWIRCNPSNFSYLEARLALHGYLFGGVAPYHSLSVYFTDAEADA
jgi:hypothetical protein